MLPFFETSCKDDVVDHPIKSHPVGQKRICGCSTTKTQCIAAATRQIKHVLSFFTQIKWPTWPKHACQMIHAYKLPTDHRIRGPHPSQKDISMSIDIISHWCATSWHCPAAAVTPHRDNRTRGHAQDDPQAKPQIKWLQAGMDVGYRHTNLWFPENRFVAYRHKPHVFLLSRSNSSYPTKDWMHVWTSLRRNNQTKKDPHGASSKT